MAEIDIPEPGNPGVSIRVIKHAVLYELSIVSRPAYGSTDVDLRAEVHAKANEGRDRRPHARSFMAVTITETALANAMRVGETTA